jgi:hypothetical protein
MLTYTVYSDSDDDSPKQKEQAKQKRYEIRLTGARKQGLEVSTLNPKVINKWYTNGWFDLFNYWCCMSYPSLTFYSSLFLIGSVWLQKLFTKLCGTLRYLFQMMTVHLWKTTHQPPHLQNGKYQPAMLFPNPGTNLHPHFKPQLLHHCLLLGTISNRGLFLIMSILRN